MQPIYLVKLDMTVPIHLNCIFCNTSLEASGAANENVLNFHLVIKLFLKIYFVMQCKEVITDLMGDGLESDVRNTFHFWMHRKFKLFKL